MSREAQVRFCERRGVRFPPPTLLIVGFEYQEDAERFLDELRGRFAEFGLELHPGKTRLIEFGRHAARNRAARGDGKPETFDFLGFTHICATSRGGRLLSAALSAHGSAAVLVDEAATLGVAEPKADCSWG